MTSIKNKKLLIGISLGVLCSLCALGTIYYYLLYPQFMDEGNEMERVMAMHFNYVLIGKCTELWGFGGVVSRGKAREIGVAKKRRMKIRWFDLLY